MTEKIKACGETIKPTTTNHLLNYICVHCKKQELLANSIERFKDELVGFSPIKPNPENRKLSKKVCGIIILKCPYCKKLNWLHVSKSTVVTYKKWGLWPSEF